MQVKALVTLVTFYSLAAACPVVRAPPPDSNPFPEQSGSLFPPWHRLAASLPALPRAAVERAVPTVQPPLQPFPKPAFPPAPPFPRSFEGNAPSDHLPPQPIPPFGTFPPIPTFGQPPPLPHSFGVGAGSSDPPASRSLFTQPSPSHYGLPPPPPHSPLLALPSLTSHTTLPQPSIPSFTSPPDWT